MEDIIRTIVIASNGTLMSSSAAGCSEEFASEGCEYLQQKLKKPLMQAWTFLETS